MSIANTIANIFRRPHYESDATLFILDLRKNDPELEARQRAGRALLWDKPINLQQKADAEAAEVPQQPYVYQTSPTQV